MKPDVFDFIGSDGGFLESDENIELHRTIWQHAMARVRIEMAVRRFQAAVRETIWPALEHMAEEAAKIIATFSESLSQLNLPSVDAKASARARSKADVKAKRREMMKRRGRK